MQQQKKFKILKILFKYKLNVKDTKNSIFMLWLMTENLFVHN